MIGILLIVAWEVIQKIDSPVHLCKIFTLRGTINEKAIQALLGQKLLFFI
jgi:hypothetical protein